jgi:hypothetical protein
MEMQCGITHLGCFPGQFGHSVRFPSLWRSSLR